MAEANSDMETPIERMSTDAMSHDHRKPAGPAASPVPAMEATEGRMPMME